MGVFHQKAGSVIIPIGVLKNHPVALYNAMWRRERTASERGGESYLNEELLSCCFHLSKPSPHPQGQQQNKCLYGMRLPVLPANIPQRCNAAPRPVSGRISFRWKFYFNAYQNCLHILISPTPQRFPRSVGFISKVHSIKSPEKAVGRGGPFKKLPAEPVSNGSELHWCTSLQRAPQC